MLTMGGFEDTGKVSVSAVGEVQRAGVEDAGPHVCTHNTDAGLDQEDNSPFQDAAQAGPPSLLVLGCLLPLLPPEQKDEDGVNPHCFSLPSSVSFFPVCPPAGSPAGAGLDWGSFV